ncbi:MAG: 30S ribosomal protein S19 [Phycisphaerae bacterium]|jgi:small subunit ribosomal protein S19
MARSSKKGPYVDENLFHKAMSARAAGSSVPIKAFNRACTIVPEFIGLTFEVYNGRHFLKVFVTEDMVGHKLGEFAPTRTFRAHTARGAAK